MVESLFPCPTVMAYIGGVYFRVVEMNKLGSLKNIGDFMSYRFLADRELFISTTLRSGCVCMIKSFGVNRCSKIEFDDRNLLSSIFDFRLALSDARAGASLCAVKIENGKLRICAALNGGEGYVLNKPVSDVTLLRAALLKSVPPAPFQAK